MRDPTLGGLLVQWQAARRCFEVAAPLFGASLGALLRPGPLRDGQWTVLADHSQAAAKARQHVPSVEEALLHAGMGPTSVKVRVLPKSGLG